jgi:hypothetical protein
MRFIAIAICVVVFAGLTLAQPGNEGSPPGLKIVSSVDKDKGQIIYIDTVMRAVPVQIEKVVIVNGQQVREIVTEYRMILETRHVVFEAAQSRVITPDGKQLPIDEVYKRLKANTVVALSAVPRRRRRRS